MRDWLINLPNELTETDLIEMVEGTLPAHREPVAIAALKSEPRLGALIKQMRADRESLGQLPSEAAAPAEVGERVISVIDRRMIRELDEVSRQQSQYIPVSTLTIEEPSALELFMQSVWTKRLALAAALLLVAGVGVLAVKSHYGKPGALTDGPIIANNGAGTAHTGAPDPLANGETSTGNVARDHQVASTPAESQPHGDGDNTLAHASDQSNELANAGSTPTLASTPETETAVSSSGSALKGADHVRGEISDAAAASLAREGRLVIVLHVTSMSEGERRAASIALGVGTRGSAESTLAAADQLPFEVATLAGQAANPAPLASSGALSPANVASGESGPDMSLSSIESTIPVAPIAKKPSPVYTAWVEPGERTLAAVRAYLETGVAQGEGEKPRSDGAATCVAEYRVLRTPVATPHELDPEHILWWSTPASRWVRTRGVPIIVVDSH